MFQVEHILQPSFVVPAANGGEDLSFSPLLIISALAFGVPLLISRFRRGLVPIVVGEIIVGMVFGRSGIGLIESNLWLEFLAQFGFAYLMFLSGLEVDFGLLGGIGSRDRGGWRSLVGNPLVVGAVIFLLCVLMASFSALALWRGRPVSHTMLLGLILSTTSVGIVVPTLKERGLIRQQLGQTILFAALVADFVTIFMITIFAGFLTAGSVLRVSLVLVLLSVSFLAIGLGSRLNRYRMVRATLRELSHATAQIQVRGALALLVVFVVLAEALRAELVLGAFLAGAIISFLSREEGSSLRTKMDAIGYGFFVPIFFIMVGAEFDLSALVESRRVLYMVPALIVVAYAVKVVPSLLLRVYYSLRETLGAGVLLSSRLSLIIAASVIGLRLGVVDAATNSAILLVAIVTAMVSPAVFNRLFPRAKVPKGRVVIVGADDAGRLLAQRLDRQGMVPVIVEIEAKRVEVARSEGLNVVLGSGTSAEVLASAGAGTAVALIATAGDDDTNLAACMAAKDNFDIPTVISQVVNHQRLVDFSRAGIKALSRPMAMAIGLDNLVMRPDIFSILADPSLPTDIKEVRLNNKSMVGQPVEKALLPGNVIILLVRRDEESFVPRPNTVLERGDLLTIAGDDDCIKDAAALLNPGGV